MSILSDIEVMTGWVDNSLAFCYSQRNKAEIYFSSYRTSQEDHSQKITTKLSIPWDYRDLLGINFGPCRFPGLPIRDATL